MQSCPTCGSPMSDDKHGVKPEAIIAIATPSKDNDDGMEAAMAKKADPGASTPDTDMSTPAPSIDAEALTEIMKILQATQMAKLPKKPGESGAV